MKQCCPHLPQIEEARRTIARTAIRTPLVRLGADGPAEIYLKLENLQPIGSFKIRGASNAMGHMSPDALARGVLTASAGNMAQGVAWCARELGIPCTVIAPETAPETKIKAIERLGGRVIKVPFEAWWQAFEERAYPGVEGAFIHAFDDPHVMAGNGIIASGNPGRPARCGRGADSLGRRRPDLRHRQRDARPQAGLQDFRGGGRDVGAARGIARRRIAASDSASGDVRRRHRQQERLPANVRTRAQR